jgi:tripartite-type tricarboxylate transporter receptor subunit TctC
MRAHYRTLVTLFAGLFLAVNTCVAAYPEKPIRSVIPGVPGGSADFIMRSIAPGMEKRLGQPVILDFRGGASGNIGMREVVRSAPDGYTLGFAPTHNVVINQFLFKKLDFDPLQALVPVTIVADTPYLIVVRGDSPVRTYADLATYARANRGKLNYGSPGPASVPHMSGYMLSEAMGADMVHIGFRGNPPAVLALLANEVHMVVHSYGSIAPLLKSGKLRALVVGAGTRLRSLPDVPTSAEAGVPEGALASNWWSLVVPRSTARDLVERLAREVRATLSEPELQRRYTEQGWIPGGVSPAEASERLRQEAVVWKAVVERSGLTAE